MVSTLLLGNVADFANGINGDEGLGVCLMHVVHQLAVFLFVHDGDDLGADALVIGAHSLVEAGTAVQVMEDEIHDFIGLGRQDAHPALDIQTEDKMIHHNAAKVGTHDADYHNFDIVEEN